MQNSEIPEELRAVLETIRIDTLPAYGEFEAVLAHVFGDPPAARADKRAAGQRLIAAIDDVGECVTSSQYVELMDAAKALFFSV